MLPLQNQTRRAIWSQVDPHTGRNRLEDAIPAELIQDRLENEMFIRLVNGSTIQFIGSDAWSNLVGSSPCGLVWSEWATSDPNSWVYLQPILTENNGWALFEGTPEGHNHMAEMYEKRKDDPEWFCELLTAHDTKHLTDEQLAEAKKELIDVYGEDVGSGYFNCQYMCSFTSALVGSYYGTEIERLYANGQITDVAYDPKFAVHTSWDIGGTTAIIFFQLIGPKIHIIDYLESTQMAADYYVRMVQLKPYTYQHHLFPADLEEQDDWSNPRSRIITLKELGLKARVLPKQKSINDGINAVIQILPSCWFDQTKCKRLINALQQYHRRYDEKRQVFEEKAYHDMHSHAADAMRYLAVSGVRNMVKKDLPKPRYAIV